jgi:hypothetical protein
MNKEATGNSTGKSTSAKKTEHSPINQIQSEQQT